MKGLVDARPLFHRREIPHPHPALAHGQHPGRLQHAPLQRLRDPQLVARAAVGQQALQPGRHRQAGQRPRYRRPAGGRPRQPALGLHQPDPLPGPARRLQLLEPPAEPAHGRRRLQRQRPAQPAGTGGSPGSRPARPHRRPWRAAGPLRRRPRRPGGGRGPPVAGRGFAPVAAGLHWRPAVGLSQRGADGRFQLQGRTPGNAGAVPEDPAAATGLHRADLPQLAARPRHRPHPGQQWPAHPHRGSRAGRVLRSPRAGQPASPTASSSIRCRRRTA